MTEVKLRSPLQKDFLTWQVCVLFTFTPVSAKVINLIYTTDMGPPADHV